MRDVTSHLWMHSEMLPASFSVGMTMHSLCSSRSPVSPCARSLEYPWPMVPTAQQAGNE